MKNFAKQEFGKIHSQGLIFFHRNQFLCKIKALKALFILSIESKTLKYQLLDFKKRKSLITPPSNLFTLKSLSKVKFRRVDFHMIDKTLLTS